MKLIGLTGGSGSGKTTAAKLFSDCGATIIDADAVAREIVLPESVVLKQICDTFGAIYINGDGTLNRAALGKLVFSDAEKLAQLNDIMVPAISKRIENIIEFLRASDTEVAVLDAPLLFDYHLDEICDTVILMSTPLPIRINRLIKRDGLSETAIMERIASQVDFDAYKARADYLLDATDKEMLKCDVEHIYRLLKEGCSCA